MNTKRWARCAGAALSMALCFLAPAGGYVLDYTVPSGGGCPQLDRQDIPGAILMDRWSTALPIAQTLLTAAPSGSAAQLDEIEQTITQAYGIWTGVAGTTLNAGMHPGVVAPIARTATQQACSGDQGNNADGLDTICFDQASSAFTFGVLAFTRVITADAPGEIIGSASAAVFAGQIVDADTLIRPDGQAIFATPGALATPQGQGAYDLETILAHELGHVFGLDHSAVWRAMMEPFAPPPGTFLGERPTAQTPDAPLADDDRVGLRNLYADPADTIDIGVISGRVIPANTFALATAPATSPGEYVTGIFGAHVVALDADSGAVIAGTLGGWTCDAANPPSRFDGSFTLSHLAVGRSYKIYAEPLDGLVAPGAVSAALAGLCQPSGSESCSAPGVDGSFNAAIKPSP